MWRVYGVLCRVRGQLVFTRTLCRVRTEHSRRVDCSGQCRGGRFRSRKAQECTASAHSAKKQFVCVNAQQEECQCKEAKQWQEQDQENERAEARQTRMQERQEAPPKRAAQRRATAGQAQAKAKRLAPGKPVALGTAHTRFGGSGRAQPCGKAHHYGRKEKGKEEEWSQRRERAHHCSGDREPRQRVPKNAVVRRARDLATKQKRVNSIGLFLLSV